jgi:hypothetical protein
LSFLQPSEPPHTPSPRLGSRPRARTSRCGNGHLLGIFLCQASVVVRSVRQKHSIYRKRMEKGRRRHQETTSLVLSTYPGCACPEALNRVPEPEASAAS